MNEQMTQMLELFSQPAFFAKDGSVVWCNRVATAILSPGTPLYRILEQEDALFSTWNREGILRISLFIDGNEYDASVQAHGEYDLFVAVGKNPQLDAYASALFHAAISIRKPLQTLVNAAEGLFNTLPEQTDNTCSEQLNQSIYRFIRLCGQMSDGSLLLTHRKRINRRPMDLAEFFARFVREASPLVGSLNIALEYNLPSSPVWGDADETLLERAMYNLLANALAYTAPGGTVTLNAVRQGHLLLVSVNDDGEGIPPDIAPTIFDRISDCGIGDSRWGLGLGLPMAREIARLHGGSLIIGSNDGGRGVRVTLSLSLEKTVLSLHSPSLPVDSYSSFHHGLVELSDVLNAKMFNPGEVQ